MRVETVEVSEGYVCEHECCDKRAIIRITGREGGNIYYCVDHLLILIGFLSAIRLGDLCKCSA